MKTVSVSTRVSPDEANTIDSMANRDGLERSAFLKKLIRKGVERVAFEQAVDAYREGTVSLSRAAEMAGISYRDFLLRMEDAAIELNYGVEDLKQDLEGI